MTPTEKPVLSIFQRQFNKILRIILKSESDKQFRKTILSERIATTLIFNYQEIRIFSQTHNIKWDKD